ncbi:DUF2442 domain-containing protein [Azospirillum sp.]|uniref:DUF2442 domain-containing protein n=1 Tax=Azospirillum sp. TaxID=34012 RepID=UPI003D706161
MRSVPHQQIAAVAAEAPASLLVTWKDGTGERVDLSTLIAKGRYLAPLQDPAVFRAAQVGEWGWSVEWPNGIDLSSHQLWRWAGEQKGDFMPADDFRAWMERNGMSLSKAADALGLSRRMVAYYASGERPVPKTVRLATLGFDVERRAA